MNEFDIKKAIQAEIDDRDLIVAIAVMTYILAAPLSKDILERKYRATIAKHQPPAQPKDHFSLRDYEDSMRGGGDNDE